MRCYQVCQECPRRYQETSSFNNCDAGDFEYYLVVRSVEYAAVRLGYNWPITRSNGSTVSDGDEP